MTIVEMPEFSVSIDQIGDDPVVVLSLVGPAVTARLSISPGKVEDICEMLRFAALHAASKGEAA